MIDGRAQSPAQTYFSQKDIIGLQELPHKQQPAAALAAQQLQLDAA